jgi:hypothetical protein
MPQLTKAHNLIRMIQLGVPEATLLNFVSVISSER